MRYLILLIFLSGCQGMKNRTDIYGLPLDPETRADQEASIISADQAMVQDKPKEAEESLRKFLIENPASPFYKQAQLKLGESLEMQYRWKEAAQIYQQISGANTHPRLAAMALYRLSYCFEAEGDDAKVLMALNDAEKYSAQLDPAIAKAELVARRGGALYRLGLEAKALEAFERAQKEIAKIYADDSNPEIREKKARSFYWMGHPISKDQSISLKTLSALQIFSLRAIELEDAIWSRKAVLDLRRSYGLLLADARLGAGNVDKATEIMTALNKLKQHQIVGVEPGQYKTELAVLIQQAERFATEIITKPRDLTPLTKESEDRNSIKKKGTIYSEPYFPDEKKTKGKDPNL